MAQFINGGFNDNIVGGADVVQGPIPLYQNGFNWLRFWLGCCLTLTLCFLLATFITFLVLFTLVVTGSIGQAGRMIQPTEVANLAESGKTFKSFIPPLLNKIIGFTQPLVNSIREGADAIKSNIEKNGDKSKWLKKLIPTVWDGCALPDIQKKRKYYCYFFAYYYFLVGS